MSRSPLVGRQGPTTWSRRSVLAGGGMAASALAAGGCGSPLAAGLTGSESSPDSLTLWSLLGGGDGPRFADLLDQYQADHPEVDFEEVTLGWGNPFYTKLSLATLGNRPPDVAISHLTRAGILAEADLLESIDAEALERHGLTEEKFASTAWEAAHVDGRLYAIPLDTHPWVLFYNTEICDEAGLLEGDGQLVDLDDPDRFADALAACQEVTGQWGGVTPIQDDTANCWRWFWTLYGQLGGELLAEEGTRVVLEDALALEVFDYMVELTLRRAVMPPHVAGSTAISGFAAGRAGLLLCGEWELTTFEDAGTPFSMTLVPRIFHEAPFTVQADSHSFIIPRSPGHDRRRLDTALEFMRHILDQSLAWAEGGHIPAWLPVRESQEFKELEPQSNYAQAAEIAHYDPPAWYSGSGSDLSYIVGGAVASLVAGHVRPEQALEQMRGRLQRRADTESPLG